MQTQLCSQTLENYEYRTGTSGGSRHENQRATNLNQLLVIFCNFNFDDINMIYGDAAHDRDVTHPWQPLYNQMYT